MNYFENELDNILSNIILPASESGQMVQRLVKQARFANEFAKLLKELEWIDGAYAWPYCPICNGEKDQGRRTMFTVGHTEECSLGNMLERWRLNG